MVTQDAGYYTFWHAHLGAFFLTGSLFGFVIVVLLVLIFLELRDANKMRERHHEATKNPNGPIR